ncbi:DUF6434 domain-containing protein [Aquimarina algicola]|uniref:DUF6434 domain-containing protein n=1 Tax=Aquimarina algicola TaxID=2589995 RepID=A0A504IZX2_9FLAO|nr:DUF6434 domain-containing protein [Aquimarina algicola]TPN81692.1 hypothetical protein FHK87_24130 [Aquimarina algicola]
MSRPDFENITSGKEFNNWYWLKKEMVDICKRSNLPYSGSKFELRDRIMYALDHQGKIKPKKPKNKTTSKFNWAKEQLTLDTIITDNVSFGPNFRGFMKSQIGTKFYCHGDFMDWVKSNLGKTLQDAILQWEILDQRKQDPDFKREIAKHNMYCQYIRDFLDANKGKKFADAKHSWMKKKQLPMHNGFVIYEQTDLDLI